MNTNKTLEYTIIAGLVAVLVIPFVVMSSFFFPFITGKGLLFRLIIEVITVSYICLAWRVPSFRPKLSEVFWGMVIFVVTVGIANYFSVNPVKSFWSNFERMEGYVLVLHLFAYFFVLAQFFRTRSAWRKFAKISLVLSGVVLGLEFLDVAKSLSNGVWPRSSISFGNPTYLAAYLLIHLGLFVYMYVSDTKKAILSKRHYWYVLGIVLYIVGIAFTGTRGTMLGLLGGTGTVALLLLVLDKEHKKTKKVAATLLAALVVMVGLFFALRNTPVVQNVPTLKRFADIRLETIETQPRIMLWRMAYEGFKERPLFGWGQESFNYIFAKHFDPRMYAQEQWFDRSHNMFVEWLVSTGVLGFSGYMAMLFLVMYALWKIPNTQLSVLQKSVITGTFVAYWIHNLFVFDNLTSYIFFFAFVAWIHSESVIRHQHAIGTSVEHTQDKKHAKNTQQKNQQSDDNSELREGIYMSAGFASIIALPFMLYYAVINPLNTNVNLLAAIRQEAAPASTQADVQKNYERAQKMLIDAAEADPFTQQEVREQMLQLSQRSATRLGAQNPLAASTTSMINTYALAQINETPNDPRTYFMLGAYYFNIGDAARGLDFSKKAIELSPSKQAFQNTYALLLIRANQLGEALSVAKNSYDILNENPESQVTYALALVMNKDNVTFDEIASKHPNVLSDNRVLQGLLVSGNNERLIEVGKQRIETMIKEDTFDAYPYIFTAEAYINLKKYTEAKQIINDAKTIVTRNGQKETVGQLEQFIKKIEELESQ